MKLKISSFWLAVMSAALSLAYLLPNHYAPWSSFHAEAVACVVLIIPCIWVVLQAKDSIRIYGPNLIILMAILICIMQFAYGVIEFFGILWLDIAYLFGFLIMLHVGDAWQGQKPGQVLNYLSYAFIAAAVTSLPIQVYQWMGLMAENPLIMNVPSVQRPFANIAQPNLLADLYLLSLIGMSWLVNQNKKYGRAAFVFSMLMLWGISLTGSRAGWINVVILTGVTLYSPKRIGNVTSRRAAIALFAMFVVFVVTMPIMQAVLLETQKQEITQYTSTSLYGRINVWKMMLSASLLSPWWGYGWGQTIKTNFVFEDTFGVEKGLFNQSHNIFLDYVLWVGYPLAMVFSIALIWYFLKLIRKKGDGMMWHVQMISIIFATRSLVEFPLYYMYFLLPLGLLLGAVQSQVFEKPVLEVRSIFAISAICIATVMIAMTIRDYFLIEKSYYALRFESRGYLIDQKKETPNALVITQLKEHLRFSRSEASKHNNPEDFIYMESVVRLTPGAYIMFKIALNYGLTGNADKARFWLKQICEKVAVTQCTYAEEKWRTAIQKYGDANLMPWPLQ